MTKIQTLTAAAVLFAAIAGPAAAQAASPSAATDKTVEFFDISDVRLTTGEFRHAQDMDLRYLLAIDPDRLLAPYLKGAGLTPKAENYTNWENTGLDGHIGGHYVSALSYMYAATGNPEIKGRLSYMVSELARCAEASGNGYIGGVPDGPAMWDEIRRGDIRAAAFGLNDRWVPLYNIHKTYAGLRDAWLIAGIPEAKDLFLGLVDWMYNLTEGLSDEQMQDMLRSEHGGLNEVFADAYALSGDPRHLRLAHRFTHEAVLDPLLEGRDALTGMHANTQIPKIIGVKRIADIEDNADWDKAATFFWNTVVRDRSVSIGGNSEREHFHPADDFSAMLTSEQGPETCNTYNMLRLTKMLFATTKDASYMDYYERALFNHILSTIDPVQGGFVYFTPMRSGHYRVYSQPQTSFWCCVGSGMENHSRYGESIYAHKGKEELIVNLFIPSRLSTLDFNVEMSTAFPDSDTITISVGPSTARRYTISARIPSWTEAENVQVSVNGKSVQPKTEAGYLSIDRRWKEGDRIELTLPMHLSLEGIPDGSANYSILYGPMVLAARTGTERQDGLFADDSRGGHIAAGPRIPLQDMPTIVAGSPEAVLAGISRNDSPRLSFTLSGAKPDNFASLTLEPFARVHESRYAIYFPVVSPEEYERTQADLRLREEQLAQMQAQTIDLVICGEQQPESDHFIKMDSSNAGGDPDGKHWRRPASWFSYQMKVETGGRIALSYRPCGEDSASLYVGGEHVADFGGFDSANVINQVLDLPASIAGGTLEVRIVLKDGAGNAPAVYEVRTLVKP